MLLKRVFEADWTLNAGSLVDHIMFFLAVLTHKMSTIQCPLCWWWKFMSNCQKAKGSYINPLFAIWTLHQMHLKLLLPLPLLLFKFLFSFLSVLFTAMSLKLFKYQLSATLETLDFPKFTKLQMCLQVLRLDLFITVLYIAIHDSFFALLNLVLINFSFCELFFAEFTCLFDI